MASDKTKAHLVFPKEVLSSVDQLVGKRKRSEFVAEATRKELRRVRLETALQKAAGAWKDADHPDIEEVGTYQWVMSQRAAMETRIESRPM